jgi:hypothetical protein
MVMVVVMVVANQVLKLPIGMIAVTPVDDVGFRRSGCGDQRSSRRSFDAHAALPLETRLCSSNPARSTPRGQVNSADINIPEISC